MSVHSAVTAYSTENVFLLGGRDQGEVIRQRKKTTVLHNLALCVCVYQRMEAGGSGSESIERFIEHQAFLRSQDSAPSVTPLPLTVSKLSLFLTVFLCVAGGRDY
jgi:hypothetical protein